MLHSPLTLIGGKYFLAKRLVSLFPAHELYVEAFCGSCQVLFRKAPSKVEIINDINGELVNFFRCLAAHAPEMERLASLMPRSREEFYRQLAVNPETLTDIQRAVRYFYINRNRFGGDPKSRNWAIRRSHSGGWNGSLIARLQACGGRLAHVQIERLPWQAILEKCDGEKTFFYLDPPYYGFEDWYGKGAFSRDEFSQMARVLKRLRGRFLLSLNDRPETRQIFQDFQISAIPTRYTANRDRNRNVVELVISNYELQHPGKAAPDVA